MASFAQLQRERKAALRGVRRAERGFDTKLEVMEREIMRLQKRKTMLDSRDGRRLIDMYGEANVEWQNVVGRLDDFIKIVGY